MSNQKPARNPLEGCVRFDDLVDHSPAMQELHARIRKIAVHESAVLIRGESGTGKDILARTIHKLGPRAEGAYLAINCAAVPAELLESELFGHKRGAFTGAHEDSDGLFRAADGGTLFLDEVGELPPGLQAKLLRVLNDGEIRRVGDTETVKVSVRIVSATNRDLEALMESGAFREDLYYRLNVIPVWIPPLRERPEDIEAMARVFVARHRGGRDFELSDEAIALLECQNWPGNGRQLENVIERTLVLADDLRIEPADVCLDGDTGPRVKDSLTRSLEIAAARGMPLRELEDRYIRSMLKASHGNKVQAARMLGLNRATLYRRLRDPEGDPSE